MKFIYRRVVRGQTIEMPYLEYQIEHVYPNHQQSISQTMTNFNMGDWTIIFNPMVKCKGGAISRRIKSIYLSSKTRGINDTLETLYHEIFHFKFPSATEKEVEEMAITFYALIKGMEKL